MSNGSESGPGSGSRRIFPWSSHQRLPPGARAPWTEATPVPKTSAEGFFYPAHLPLPSSSGNDNTYPLLDPLPRPSPLPHSSPPHERQREHNHEKPQGQSHSRRRSTSQPTPSPPSHKGFRFISVIVFDAIIAIFIVSLACLVYLLIGHLILRAVHAHAPVPSPYSTSLIPTIQAGVLGGSILSLPLALLMKFLFPPRGDTPPPPGVGDDFFIDNDDDDDDGRVAGGGLKETVLTRWHLHKVAVVVFGTCVGAAGAPLGIVLVMRFYGSRAGNGPGQVKMLDPLHAARAGALGGAVAGPTLFFLVWVAWRVWIGCGRRRVVEHHDV